MDTSKTYQIHICDDLQEHAVELQNLLESLNNILTCSVTITSSANAFLDMLESVEKGERTPWDITFMDIRLPENDGITLGKKIHEICPDTYLVFVTAYSEYAIKGYEAAAYRYLLKPVKTEDLLTLITDIQEERNKKKKILLKGNKSSTYLSLIDILYISAEDKYAIVHTKNGHFISDISLNKYEEQLNSHGFYRVHRKYLVNVYHHHSLHDNRVNLSDGASLPVSKSKASAYRDYVFAYMRDKLV